MILSTTVGEKAKALQMLARSVADIDGDAAECGVFQGGSLRKIAEALPNKMVFGFDTFTGLPKEAWTEGELHSVGDFRNTSLKKVYDYISDLPNVRLCPGTFPASAEKLGDNKFAFVYIDFDFYESTRAAIAWFRPRMTHGSLMVFDDYGWQFCPGVERAISEAGLRVTKTANCQVAVRM